MSQPGAAGIAPRSPRASSVGDPTTGGDIQFGRGATLTLAVAFVALVGPLLITIAGLGRPGDGWAHQTDPEQRFRLFIDVDDRPTPLRVGDVIVAINGEPLHYGYRSALPEALHVGETLRYSIARDNAPLDVDVVMVGQSLRTVANYLAGMIRTDPASIAVPGLILLVVGFTFWRRPGNTAARLLLVAFAFFAGGNWFGYANWDPYVYAYPVALAFASIVYFSGWAWLFFPALTHLALAFPVPIGLLHRFPRGVPAFLYGVPGVALLVAAPLEMAGHMVASTIDNILVAYTASLFVVTLVVTLVYRFVTVREPVARAQLGWIALGLGVGWGGGIALSLLSFAFPAFQPVTDAATAILFALLPVSLAIAITRHRLFDIDVIVNRALVYGGLTATLAAIYFSSIVALQGMFRALTGQGSSLAIVASTLAIAGLFQPLRRRLQAFIDRRFYRRKYDATLVLAAHRATLRDEVDIGSLRTALLRAASDTMHPTHISLWMHTGKNQP